MASVSSVMPMPARWRSPMLRSLISFWLTGNTQPAAIDPPLVDDHAAVVQRGFRMKNGRDQFAGKPGIHGHARLRVGLQVDAALQREQRADTLVGELRHGLDQLVHGRLLVAVERKKPVAAEFREHAAQFRLEDDDQAQRRRRRRSSGSAS